MSTFSLPVGAYLGWRYTDRRRAIERVQLYHDDGLVELIEGDTRIELCRLSQELVVAAMGAIRSSGLANSADTSAGTATDTATVVYSWRIDGKAGRVANFGYPAATLPAIEKLEAALAEIEAAAGCRPLMADEAAAAEYAAMDD